MNPELLLLSSRIAALVLVASMLAFGLGWWWQALRRRSDLRGSAEEMEKRALAEQQLVALKQSFADTEQQCMTALEQRDEAERQAIARNAEVNRLTDQITSLHATMAPREELERIKQVLAERDQELWQPRTAPVEGPNPLQADVDALGAERDALNLKLADSTAAFAQAEMAKREAESALEDLAGERQAREHAQSERDALRVERDALNQKLSDLNATLERIENEKRASESALQARIDELQRTTPEPAPARTFTLTSPRLTAQPFLPVSSLGTDQTSAAAPESGGESGEITFPPAPVRADVRDGLFRDADISSLPPDQPSLEDVHDVLTRMALELDEKEQVLAALSQEVGQREQSLSDLRREEPSAHDKLKAAEKRVAEVHKRETEAEGDRNRARRHLRAVRRSIEVLESQPIRADNLTLIKGVKSVINSQLHAYGIFTFRQIVQWDEEDLQAFSELLSFKQRIWRDKWQDQARQLHESRYGERLA